MVITTKNLGKRYGRTLAVSGVSLGVGEGEIFGFLGPNGAGKTTTIRLVLGFLRPSAGTATVLGCDAWREGGSALIVLPRALSFLLLRSRAASAAIPEPHGSITAPTRQD